MHPENLKAFDKSMNLCIDLFGELAFRKMQKNKDGTLAWRYGKINKSMFECVSASFAKLSEEKQNKLLDAIRDLYEHQQFSQISALLKDSKWAENPALQKWMQKVQARQDFESAIGQISSYCLVLMKLNTLLPKE